ncbi:flippase [Rhodopirellula sp. JC740]|uniref:Flippase n=1 Tax=Rhodopirellula halodulae TaxID=2894198 RepID=A0ABS8NFN2_9BACT|nr:flippase [Rhodopirellula sp. JC740]MCC9642365.1 flippase [Rhodopirellula sp. JC740]
MSDVAIKRSGMRGKVDKLRRRLSKQQGQSCGMILKTGIAFVLKVLSAIIAFAFNLVVARQLSHDDAGVFFLGLSLVIMLATFTRLGMDQAVTRLVAERIPERNWSGIRRCYRLSMILGLITSSVLAVVLMLGSGYLSKRVFQSELQPVLMVISVAIIPVALCMLHARFFQGLKQMVGLQLYQNLGPTLIYLSAIAVLWLSGSDTSNLNLSVGVLTLSYFVALAVAVLHWRLSSEGEFRHLDRSPELTESNVDPVSRSVVTDAADSHTGAELEKHHTIGMRYLLATSLPLWGITVVAMMDRWFGQLVVGAWCDISQVATFNVALRLAMLISIVVMSVNSISFPTFASLHRQNKTDELRRSALLASWMTLAMGLPLALFVLIFPGWLLGFFGAEFREGIHVLRALAIGQVANVASGSVGGLLVMTGHQNVSLKISIGTAIGMIALTLVLVPCLGILGAGIANALSVSVQMILCVVMVRYKLGFWPMGFHRSPSTQPSTL